MGTVRKKKQTPNHARGTVHPPNYCLLKVDHYTLNLRLWNIFTAITFLQFCSVEIGSDIKEYLFSFIRVSTHQSFERKKKRIPS